MNELIENILRDFQVDGVNIPVNFLVYNGHEDQYVTYQEQDEDNSFSADDELLAYVAYYDFDVYSKGNFNQIISELKKILKENDFVYQPSRSSIDMFEPETGFYHKTLNFAHFKEEE